MRRARRLWVLPVLMITMVPIRRSRNNAQKQREIIVEIESLLRIMTTIKRVKRRPRLPKAELAAPAGAERSHLVPLLTIRRRPSRVLLAAIRRIKKVRTTNRRRLHQARRTD